MRWILRIAFINLAVFTTTILLIRAQPYDDVELRSFLAPDGDCVSPCFMGITPGVTRLNDALRILEAHEWVGEISIENLPFITWTWSGLQPHAIDAESKGALYAEGARQKVWDIAIRTRLSVASMYLLNGGPRITDAFRDDESWADNMFIGTAYPDLSVLIFTQLPCPANLQQFWNSWLGLEFKPRVNPNPRNTIELLC